MKRKPATDAADPAETADANWMEPFKKPGFHAVINVGVMTPQQRAEVMARGVRTGITNMGKFVELGVQTSQTQAKRARKSRADEELKAIVCRLAQCGATAKELWPELCNKLDTNGCDPVEHTDGGQRQWKITYTDARGHDRSVSFDTFQRMLGKNKKPE